MEATRFCSACGEALPTGGRYCSKCGAASGPGMTPALAMAGPGATVNVVVEQKGNSTQTAVRMVGLLIVILFGMGLTCAKPVVGILFLLVVGIAIGLRNIAKR